MEKAITCSSCEKTSDDLKICAGCGTAGYCDQTCQKAHWPTHKKECAARSNIKRARRNDRKPFTSIHKGTFLHDREEEETFKIVIDLVRMRQEDEYNVDNVRMKGTIYDGEETSEGAMRGFLEKAKGKQSFLPEWWTDSKTEECVEFSRTNEDFALEHAQKKSDIVEAWKDEKMPMKLRLLGEKVYGNSPGGVSGETILRQMMMIETSGAPGFQTLLDMSGVLGRNMRG